MGKPQGILQCPALKDNRAVTHLRPEGPRANTVKELGDGEGCRENYLVRSMTFGQATQHSQGNPTGEEAGENKPLLLSPSLNLLPENPLTKLSWKPEALQRREEQPPLAKSKVKKIR